MTHETDSIVYENRRFEPPSYFLSANTGKHLKCLAYEDGWSNWRDFFYMRVLPDKPEDMSLASQLQKMVTVFLFDEFDERRSSDGIG